MESNNELFKYDRCNFEPYLKCTEQEVCLSCIKNENQINEQWINSMKNRETVNNSDVVVVATT